MLTCSLLRAGGRWPVCRLFQYWENVGLAYSLLVCFGGRVGIDMLTCSFVGAGLDWIVVCAPVGGGWGLACLLACCLSVLLFVQTK